MSTQSLTGMKMARSVIDTPGLIMSDEKKFPSSTNLTIWLIRLIILAYALFQAYIWRFHVYFDDSVAYMEMARFLLAGQPEQLVNGNWSPLYPVLIAAVFKLFNPEPLWQLSYVHGLNIALFILKYLCFERFLGQLLKLRASLKTLAQNEVMSESWIRVMALIIFGLASFSFGGAHQESPDYLVHGFALLGLAELISIKLKEKDKQPTYTNYIVLGLCCGFGYLAKSVFTLIAGLYLLLGFCLAKDGRFKKTAITASLFLAAYAPFAILVSSKLGYFAATEAGKLSYMQVVTEQYHPTRPRGEELENPVRIINENPLVVEFSTDLGETYPPFFERLQWMKGYKLKFSFMTSFVAFMVNLIVYLVKFISCILLFALFWFIFFKKPPWTKDLFSNYWLPLSYPFVLLGTFTLITNVVGHSRYIESAAMVVLVTMLVALKMPTKASNIKVGICCAVFTLPLVLAFVTINMKADLKAVSLMKNPESWWIASDLKDIGLKPGDRVAQMGYDTRVERIGDLKLEVVSDYYWAQLADLQICVDIPHFEEFKKLSTEKQEELLNSLKTYGVKAIVLYRGLKPAPKSRGWHRLEKSGSFAYLLEAPSPSKTP